jgi:hypothetical protein
MHNLDLCKCRKEHQGFLSKTGNLEIRMKDLPRKDMGNMILPVDLEKFASKTMTKHKLL